MTTFCGKRAAFCMTAPMARRPRITLAGCSGSLPRCACLHYAMLLSNSCTGGAALTSQRAPAPHASWKACYGMNLCEVLGALPTVCGHCLRYSSLFLLLCAQCHTVYSVTTKQVGMHGRVWGLPETTLTRATRCWVTSSWSWRRCHPDPDLFACLKGIIREPCMHNALLGRQISEIVARLKVHVGL